MQSPGQRDFSKRVFAASVLLLALLVAFVLGLLVFATRIFPYSLISNATFAFKDARKNWKSDLGIEPTRHLRERRYSGNGVTLSDKDKASPGVTLLTGLLDGKLLVRLIDLSGNVIHDWPANVRERFPATSAAEFCCGEYAPRDDWEAEIQGSYLLPDGSVVFNVFDAGLVRLDRCGKEEWIIPIRSHHSLSPSLDGSMFWVPTTVLRWGASPDYPLLSPPFDEQFLTLVTLDGQVVRSISVLSILMKNELLGNLFGNNGREEPGNLYPRGFVNQDITHLNSIKVLTEDLSQSFPLFSPGDLMVSLRNLNLILVLDPQKLTVKWSQAGPWLRQHDPVFRPDGTISVFNNRPGLSHSEITIIDPLSRKAGAAFPHTAPRSEFYTAVTGTQQFLPNGNLLLTEYEAGRAFEVTPSGEVVWEFVAGYDKERVGTLTGATRYPKGYLDNPDFSCSK